MKIRVCLGAMLMLKIHQGFSSFLVDVLMTQLNSYYFFVNSSDQNDNKDTEVSVLK